MWRVWSTQQTQHDLKTRIRVCVVLLHCACLLYLAHSLHLRVEAIFGVQRCMWTKTLWGEVGGGNSWWDERWCRLLKQLYGFSFCLFVLFTYELNFSIFQQQSVLQSVWSGTRLSCSGGKGDIFWYPCPRYPIRRENTWKRRSYLLVCWWRPLHIRFGAAVRKKVIDRTLTKTTTIYNIWENNIHVLWFQLSICEQVVVHWVLYNRTLNIFGLWSEQDIYGRQLKISPFSDVFDTKQQIDHRWS